MKRPLHRRLTTITGSLLLIAGILLYGQEGMTMDALKISSPAFEHNGSIPAKYTCDGADLNPPLLIGAVPEGTKSLALIVDDPDAQGGAWVHWVLWNISPNTADIREGSLPKGAQEGVNDFRRHAYGGPCPPSGTHRYFFRLYALDTLLTLAPGARRADLERAMKGHVLAQAELMGLYKKR